MSYEEEDTCSEATHLPPAAYDGRQEGGRSGPSHPTHHTAPAVGKRLNVIRGGGYMLRGTCYMRSHPTRHTAPAMQKKRNSKKIKGGRKEIKNERPKASAETHCTCSTRKKAIKKIGKTEGRPPSSAASLVHDREKEKRKRGISGKRHLNSSSTTHCCKFSHRQREGLPSSKTRGKKKGEAERGKSAPSLLRCND
jgi:hypothetical protein